MYFAFLGFLLIKNTVGDLIYSMPNKSKYFSAFTLIELLIVVVIISILAGVTLTIINPVTIRNRTQDAVVTSNFTKAITNFEGYYSAYGAYPAVGGCTDGNSATPCAVTRGFNNIDWENGETNQYYFRASNIPFDSSRPNPNATGFSSPGVIGYIVNASNNICVVSHLFSSKTVYRWQSTTNKIEICSYTGTYTTSTILSTACGFTSSTTGVTCRNIN